MKQVGVGQFWMDPEPGPLGRLVVVKKIDDILVIVQDLATGKDEEIPRYRFENREQYTLGPTFNVTDEAPGPTAQVWTTQDTPERDAFRFNANGTPVMSIHPDGRFFIKGEEVETTEEIRDTLAAWCKTWNARVWELEAENRRLRSEVERLRADKGRSEGQEGR